MAALALHFLAALAAVTAIVSFGVAGAVWALERWAPAVGPVARARLLLVAALTPAFVVALVQTALGADLVLHACALHGCVIDHLAAWPSSPAALVGALFGLRLLFLAGRSGHAALRAFRLRRLLATVSRETPNGWRLLPGGEPQAFVIGALRPDVYLSQGLVSRASERELSLILEHERSHARRRDPLRRFVASLGLAFHLPGLAGALESRLARAHEMAADAETAQIVGDRARVAATLLRFARLRVTSPTGAAALVGGDLETRVRSLLEPGSARTAPCARFLASAGAGALVLAVLAAHPIHNGIEALLAALAS